MFFFQKLPFCLCCCLQHLRFCSRTKRTLQGAFWKAFSGTTILLSTIRSKGPLFFAFVMSKSAVVFQTNFLSWVYNVILDFATICTVYDFLMIQVRNLLSALHYRLNFQMLSENYKNILLASKSEYRIQIKHQKLITQMKLVFTSKNAF